jgi:lipopolysaccharide export system permease protein
VLPNIRRVPTRDLIRDRYALAAEYGFSHGEIIEELHQRFSWALICLAVGMLGFSVLMVGGFSRFGLWPQVLTAFVALLLLEGLRGTASPLVERMPNLWWVLYAPSILGLGLSVVCLRLAGRPLRAGAAAT